jgi:hypothetical protein
MLAWHVYHWEFGIWHGVGGLVFLMLLVILAVVLLGGSKSNN